MPKKKRPWNSYAIPDISTRAGQAREASRFRRSPRIPSSQRLRAEMDLVRRCRKLHAFPWEGIPGIGMIPGIGWATFLVARLPRMNRCHENSEEPTVPRKYRNAPAPRAALPAGITGAGREHPGRAGILRLPLSRPKGYSRSRYPGPRREPLPSTTGSCQETECRKFRRNPAAAGRPPSPMGTGAKPSLFPFLSFPTSRLSQPLCPDQRGKTGIPKCFLTEASAFPSASPVCELPAAPLPLLAAKHRIPAQNSRISPGKRSLTPVPGLFHRENRAWILSLDPGVCFPQPQRSRGRFGNVGIVSFRHHGMGFSHQPRLLRAGFGHFQGWGKRGIKNGNSLKEEHRE